MREPHEIERAIRVLKKFAAEPIGDRRREITLAVVTALEWSIGKDATRFQMLIDGLDSSHRCERN